MLYLEITRRKLLYVRLTSLLLLLLLLFLFCSSLGFFWGIVVFFSFIIITRTALLFLGALCEICWMLVASPHEEE